ncbi:MAG TPA: acyl-CoA dehydrogenase [Solirubrobacterales bacterium]|jgi:acyl-CoA oxidase|nr:acyl-CoA dehydrogenase [Solirubrobacterales bacterium]
MSVDPVALRRLLDGEYAIVREHVRAVLLRPEFEKPPAPPPTERYREQVSERARILAATGGPSLLFPEEFGGLGRVGAAITAFETLAHSDLSLLVKIGVQFGLFGGAVHHLGTRKHHEAYLQRIASLELPGCFAMSETGHGSNVQRVETTATWDGDAGEFVVETPTEAARKDYIGNAALDGRMAVVFCQLIVGGEGRGVHAVLVPIRDEDGTRCAGVEIEDCGEKLGLNGVDNGRLAFHGVRVARTALLDRYAEVTADGEYRSPIESENRRFFTMLGTLVQGRVSVGGASISATKSALAIAIRHGARRRQFGPPDSEEEYPLLDFRVHQRRLLPALATTYALHFAQERVVAELDRIFGSLGGGEEEAERDRRELETRAAGLKAIATWHATETIQTCREACGGAGYLSENRLGELKADTDVFTTFEGDNTILLQLVAKSLLTGYRDEFAELGPMATAGFMASQAWETVVERSAGRELIQRLTDDLVPGRERDEDLLDREYQLGLFRWREEHVLSGAARRLRRGMGSDGADPFEVFNDCQDHVLVAARAHVHREILDSFSEAIERAEDTNLRAVLERLCDLYALGELERDRAWLQEHGRISSTRAKMLTRTVNGLCAEIRPHAEALVDAFGIPDGLIAAPIGLPGGEASRTSSADVGDELPNVREILERVGEEALH